MNDLLKEKLQTIAGDEYMMQALRVVFDEQAAKEKPQIESGDNNYLLGEKYRAYEAGRRIIEQSFIELAGHKIISDNSKQFNKER